MSNVQPVPGTPASVEFRYSQTDAFPAVLRELGAALVITIQHTFIVPEKSALRGGRQIVSTI